MEADKQETNYYIPSQIHNAKIIQYFQDLSCLILGSTCGILQLKAVNGLIFFIVTSILTSSIYHFTIISFRRPINKQKYKIKQFYSTPLKDIYLGDLGRKIATFTMMWCLLNALVA